MAAEKQRSEVLTGSVTEHRAWIAPHSPGQPAKGQTGPIGYVEVVGDTGLEPVTSCVSSGARCGSSSS